MLNLIKMDIHRLFKTKAFKSGLVISVIISAVIILGVFGMILLQRFMGGDGSGASLFIGDILTWQDGVSLFEIISMSLPKLSLLVICVVSAVFISEEQLSGYVKNVAGQTRDKGLLVFSKFVTLAVLIFFIFLAYCIGSGIVGFIFFHKNMTFAMAGSFLAALAVRYLIYLAIGTIVLFLCTLTKNKSLAIAISVIFGIGITNIAYTTIEMFLSLVLKINLNISAIMPDGFVSAVQMGCDTTTLIQGAVSAVIYIVIFLFISYMVMKKRDTR